MAWRFTAVLCGFTVALCSGVTALNLAVRDVRVETRTVKEDPGPPTGTIAGKDLNAQLDGLSCDYWASKTGVTFVCKS